ncbi:MAG: hypothetical protein H0V82_03025 [Candidatus Protochlamydia sp.]|nr:hypothetical protein [Candidatus Protochlamydia sp.]
MKKIIFLLLTTITNLEALHFQSETSFIPLNNERNEHSVNIRLEKVREGPTELVAAPRFICTPGEPTILVMASEDEMELVSIKVALKENGGQRDVQN